MVEYIVLIIVVLASGTLANQFGFHSAWLLGPLIICTIPSVYAMFTGSPYLPTDRETLKRMVALAQLQPGETVVDLGCGDGRFVRAAAQSCAQAIGYELSIYLYLIARFMGGGKIYYKSYWKADLKDADVIFMYLEKRYLPRFEDELWPQLKPGCRVIANTFPLPTITPETKDGTHIYRYVKN